MAEKIAKQYGNAQEISCLFYSQVNATDPNLEDVPQHNRHLF